MTMRRTAADLTTRFRIEGLDTIRTRLTDFGNRIRSTMERVNNSKSMERVRASVDRIKATTEKAAKALKTNFTEAVRNAGRVAHATFDKMAKSISHVSNLVKNLIGRLKGIGLAAAGVAGVAGLLSPVGAAAKVASDVKEEAGDIDRIRSQSQRQNLAPYQLDALEKIGRVGGIEKEGMASLIDKLNESFGHLNPAQRLQQLQAIGRQYRMIVGAPAKKEFLISQFGLENLDNAQRLMGQLQVQHGGLWTQIEMQRRNGNDLVSQRDIRMAELYRRSVMAMQDAFAKLRRVVFRVFGPVVINWIRFFTNYIERNHLKVVGRMIQAYDTFIIALRDVLKVFFGIETGWQVQHHWMQRVNDFLVSMIRNLPGYVRYAISAVATVIASIRDGFQAARAWVHQFGADLNAVLSGRDSEVSSQNRWMVGLKTAAIDTIQSIKGGFDALYGYVAAVFVGIGAIWAQVAAGMAAAEFSQTEGALYNVGAAVRIVYEWTSELVQQLYKMFALGEDATGGFAWLNVVRDFVIDFYHHVSTAIGWISGLINSLHDFFAQWGWDLKSSLLFIGLLSLTGAGGLFMAIIGLIGKVIGKFGLFDKAVAASGGALSKFMALAGPWAAAIGYFISMTTLFYNVLKNSPVNDWIQGVTDKLLGVEDAMKRVASANNASLDRYGDKQASAAEYARSQRAAPYPAALPYASMSDLNSIITLQNGARPTSTKTRSTPVTINLGNGRSIEAESDQSASEIQGAFRSAGLSP